MYCGAFTIVARCERTGMLGVGLVSSSLAGGAHVPHLKTGAGVIATQGFVNPLIGVEGLELLAQGTASHEAVALLAEADDGRDFRQFALVNAAGQAAAHTGTECIGWAGQIVRPGFAVIGNMLMGDDTLRAMASTFLANSIYELPDRLLLALEWGQAAGGDRRAPRSAALSVVQAQDYRYVDLRVDSHPDAVRELRRLFEETREDGLLDQDERPTKENPVGDLRLVRSRVEFLR